MKHQETLTGVSESRLFGALAEALEDQAVYVVDAQQRLVFWSVGATRLLGFTRDEVIGQHCLKASRCVNCMQSCGVQAHAIIRGAELEMFRKDGTTVRVNKSARALHDEAGRFLGAVEVLTPVHATSHDDADPSSSDAELQALQGLLSRSPTMHALFATLRNVARTDVTVLIRGESGSGKEIVARALHAESARRDRPFLAVNCAALSPQLLDSELFGHERGAFTGAVSAHTGVFERADGGTLFLDEVAELPVELQAKLLRVLEERSFYRVGGKKAVHVDVRIISATHRSLKREVAQGRFREDLMYRLRVVPIFLPPLRDRREDISALVRHFVDALNERGGRVVTSVAPNAFRRLLEHRWPGNVRELRNAIEYAFAVGEGAVLRASDLPPDLRDTASTTTPAPTLEPRRGERKVLSAQEIERALRETGGNVGDAARLLGVSRPTLWRRRRELAVRSAQPDAPTSR